MPIPLRHPAARAFAAALFCLCAALPAAAQTVDYLGLPGPIRFDGETYQLAWSSHPSPNYIKQEYVPQGQSVEHYTRMILVERLISNLNVANVVRIQTDTLKARTASDPLVDMDLITNDKTGEKLLDFIMSDKKAGEEIVEWNGYRYAPTLAPDGGRGVLLFAISRRAYGATDTLTFLHDLKAIRPGQIDALATAPLPQPAK